MLVLDLIKILLMPFVMLGVLLLIGISIIGWVIVVGIALVLFELYKTMFTGVEEL